MRRIFLGGSYVGAVTAGAVASAQLWMQALSVDERSAIRELALPGTQERSVPALVEPARPSSAKPTVSPSLFTGFTQVFVSPGEGISVSVPGSPAPGVPAPGSPVPGTAVPGQP